MSSLRKTKPQWLWSRQRRLFVKLSPEVTISRLYQDSSDESIARCRVRLKEINAMLTKAGV